MTTASRLRVRCGDTYLSPIWAIVLDGAAVDLTTDGWAVRAQARDSDGVLVEDFDSDEDGTDVLLGTATVTVNGDEVTTSTVRLYLSPTATASLTPQATLAFDIEIENATYGPLGDLYRATVVAGSIQVIGDTTRPAA